MFHYILLGIYILALIFLSGFLAIFIVHIRDYFQYSKYIKTILRVYITIVLCIAVFWGYQILTGNPPSLSTESTIQTVPLNF